MKFQHQDMLALNASPIFKNYLNDNYYDEELERIKLEKSGPLKELEDFQERIESDPDLKNKLQNLVKYLQRHPEEITDDNLMEALMLLKL